MSASLRQAIIHEIPVCRGVEMPKEGNMSTGIMIIGPSGSGKTTLGKAVAEKLGYSIST